MNGELRPATGGDDGDHVPEDDDQDDQDDQDEEGAVASNEQPGTGIELRSATSADVDAIADVWHGAWRDGHAGHVPDGLVRHRTLDDFRRRVPARIAETTVATISGSVVGFVVVVGDELEQLFVAGRARGTGAAIALIEHAERSIASDHDVAWLAVVEGNARARHFYERHGWRDVGAITYRAETADGTFDVPTLRYEKALR